ncbi:hypothetical protein OIU34_02550 [Pararhizobium sp. BT-229]|uniref:hypothetical protein n=1 Tax=Pararhizobium sp. BT-229 TaxID=2986923 RepID=UPI0021F763C7|nr:hypothetical protein [Pararhizobium sp. BT-229]MCV9960768.1 hypothetical protein [Pararhizobium sp. BT-229]
MTKTFKERLAAQRYDKEQLRKRVLPLYAFYARDSEFERRRLQFYTDMEKALKEEVRAPKKKVATGGVSGRDGRKAELASIGRERAMPVITNSAPLEHLFSKGMLQGKRDSHGAAYRRLSVGLRLRGICEGAEISGLRAANLEGASGGGMPGRLPGEYKMDCIRWLAELRGANEIAGLAQSPFSIIEDLVYHDKWVWEKVRPDRRERFLLKIHRALDELSVRFYMMAERDFNARWHPEQPRAEAQGSPDPSPAPGPEATSAPTQSEMPPTGSEP